MRMEREEVARLGRVNGELKLKIMEYREKIMNIRRDAGVMREGEEKEPLGLQKIIINQSKIIDKQCDEHHQQNS